ncbi:glycoside hydrolase/phage tail family protein [uncultured Shimia sp.]|mgnify:CR=1 FL=1|uniref:baseplate multidomain protein megatron n=1 Tax=uncultured Shimia sp. TaxID=573152 RepID=UPI0025F9F1D6|nr:glycoside hydrolase/phage tail family protein [uncultured Shimia sp.]
MATVILAAAGAAVGGAVGGGFAGVSSAAIGQLAGATLGRVIDQNLMGAGSDVIETGKIDRFRLTGSAEGAAQARVFGRVRVAGQVIWATRFQESVTETGGGKGMPSQPKTRSYSYTVSLAIALCEGEILRVGRMWADGVEVGREEFNLRVYTGAPDQMPDPKIEAVEGTRTVPAYRGTAYVMIEDLSLDRFGNRVPQFNFEVVRATPEHVPEKASDYSKTVRAVALMPGTGEYALATTPVYCRHRDGETRVANEHTPSGLTNFVTSLQDMQEELPQCEAASLVVSWFGSDLRMAECALRPKVEDVAVDGDNMPWQVSGLPRAAAQEVEQLDGRPIYGGTPADAAVVQAIQHMAAIGTNVTFYPFILMEQMADNGLSDPWSNAADQPVLPWRGRITISEAPGRSGSPDGTPQADAEVTAFFGTATAADFQVNGESVSYNGPAEWSYRRFILHYAALCAAAGGVEAFCIGSEMRGLTQVRGPAGFPAVAALRDLAQEVRTLLGASVKLGYAADWSEYFGYHPKDGSGDVYFHLDPLWADENIDFIGIDNYTPLSDWRDSSEHLDALDGHSPQDVEYLKSNFEGGEGYEWFYPTEEARATQARSAITDGAYQEPWVFRYKDLRSWWGQSHHERVGGVRLSQSTAWVPQSKPIWFTEIGCAAIDKGPNQPNKFLDEKSSESAIPYFSTGLRNDEVQQRYYQAFFEHYSDTSFNPNSSIYGAPMVDRDHMFAWAWDARPFPAFPNAQDLWSDGGNYAKGHWINGRVTNRTLASVVEEVCLNAGISAYDVSGLQGVVRGFLQNDVADGRAALQPLMLRHGFDAIERDGVLQFVMRSDQRKVVIDANRLVESEEIEGDVEFSRQADAELAGRVRLSFVQAERDFRTVSEEAVLHDEATFAVSHSDVEEVLTRGEGRQTAERWLAEARVARDRVKLALPPSRMNIGAGDLLEMSLGAGIHQNFRLDRLTQQGAQILEGARTELALYKPSDMKDEVAPKSRFVPPVPVQSLFLDLPLMTGDEVPHVPHLAVTGRPWPGAVAIYSSGSDEGYELSTLIEGSAIVGITETSLGQSGAGTWDEGAALQVRMVNGALRSVSELDVLKGKNVAFVGDGQPDRWEVFQYQDAELIGENQYALSRRLRGQLGSDATAPAVWPVGSWVVFISSKLTQLSLARQTRGQPQHFRIGPAHRGLHDPSFTHHVETFSGVGLRPYAPVHLTRETFLNGDMGLNWIRRGRIDADSWDGYEVPLGEETELYLLRIRRGSDVLREVHVTEAHWLYSIADQAVDEGLVDTVAEVAQISAVTGPGPFRSIPLGN